VCSSASARAIRAPRPTGSPTSQFTLYGDCSRGRRPSFTDALLPQAAEPLYEYFVERLRKAGHRVETGRFGAAMSVDIVNDGPVTLWLDSATAALAARDKK
jgi:D-aminoacyl-tRNA deacylase